MLIMKLKITTKVVTPSKFKYTYIYSCSALAKFFCFFLKYWTVKKTRLTQNNCFIVFVILDTWWSIFQKNKNIFQTVIYRLKGQPSVLVSFRPENPIHEETLLSETIYLGLTKHDNDNIEKYIAYSKQQFGREGGPILGMKQKDFCFPTRSSTLIIRIIACPPNGNSFSSYMKWTEEEKNTFKAQCSWIGGLGNR